MGKMKGNDRNEAVMPSLSAVILHIVMSVWESYTLIFLSRAFEKKCDSDFVLKSSATEKIANSEFSSIVSEALYIFSRGTEDSRTS